ncbi:uncharacterized protein [Henckelia pumila]|uniref:uncharacterized protein n=1 Tax=Henckelia pumila TaxID=405737 RepID=UPI003C6E9D32
MARYYNTTSYYDYLQYLSLPIHFFFFLATLFLFLTLTWYINYESRFDSMMDHVKFLLMAFPVLLLLVVYWLSSDVGERAPLVWSLPEKNSLHKVGGSPFGVAIVLMFLMFMISHHASLKERWFPLFSRR